MKPRGKRGPAAPIPEISPRYQRYLEKFIREAEADKMLGSKWDRYRMRRALSYRNAYNIWLAISKHLGADAEVAPPLTQVHDDLDWQFITMARRLRALSEKHFRRCFEHLKQELAHAELADTSGDEDRTPPIRNKK